MCVLLQAQRNNEDVEAIKPLFSVNVEHRVSKTWYFVSPRDTQA